MVSAEHPFCTYHVDEFLERKLLDMDAAEAVVLHYRGSHWQRVDVAFWDAEDSAEPCDWMDAQKSVQEATQLCCAAPSCRRYSHNSSIGGRS